MSSVGGAGSTPVGIEYLATEETYSVTAPTGQGQGKVKAKTMSEANVNQLLAAYGLQANNGTFKSVDGFKVDATNASMVSSFGDAPPLPTTAGEADNAHLSDRLGWLKDSGDGALMWMALSELARTAMRDMQDARQVKHAMSSAKISSKKTQLDATEQRIAAQREEAERIFRDTVITSVVVCAIACAAACAGTYGPAISACASAAGQVYQSYSTMNSKTDGPQAEADDKELEAMRWELQAEMMDQMVEEAQSSYEESKELFKLALRILTEHYELQSQATQTYTRG
jgi:hypothetical protein